MSETNRPVHEIRLGRITGAIWKNDDGQDKAWHTVQVSRVYKTGEKWERSSSFGRDDLPLVAKVVDLCHTWCFENPPGQVEKSQAA